MKVKRITGKLQFMAASEAAKHIPAKILEQIRRFDPKPLFKVFVLGHEGKSSPTVVGFGTKVANWLRSGIEKLYDKLKIGAKCFHLHNDDNSQEERDPVGELVGKFKKTIKDNLHVFGINYIYPQYRDEKQTVASIETDIDFPETEEEFDIEGPEVGDVTGIALADGDYNTPAFENATLQAAFQFFKQKQKQEVIMEHDGEEDDTDDVKKKVEVTFKMVKDFIAKEEVTVVQLFDLDTILKTPQVTAKINEQFVPKKTHDAEIKKRDEQIADFKAKTTQQEVKELLIAAIAEREIENEKLKQFLTDNIGGFKFDEDGPKLKKQMDSYLNKEIERFNTYFGEEDGSKSKTGDEKGVGPAEDETKDGGEVDYTKPENNPLIPVE